MSTREEEYLRRMKALGYEPDLRGMDDEDIEWELSKMEKNDRRRETEWQQPLQTVYRPVDPGLKARILRMFGQPHDESMIPEGQKFYLNGWDNGEDDEYTTQETKSKLNYYSPTGGEARKSDWGDGGNSAHRMSLNGAAAGDTTTTNANESMYDDDDRKEIASISEFKKRYGKMIVERAKELGVDPDLLGATIWVESNGSGFSDNKLKVRFENHHFIDKAGQDYGLFAGEEWGSPHNFRTSQNDDWKPVHTSNQGDEHAALEVAKQLNPDAAYRSTSMGLGQIMGFKHSAAGYNSAKEMFDDFSRGHTPQINGMVSFIRNDKNGDLLKDLQNNNLRGFVAKYNGTGNVDDYLEKLQNGITSYKSY